MKTVFMGTPDFAAVILKGMIDAGIPVAECVTNPDRPRGRKGTPVPSEVKALALTYGIPVFETAKVRSEEAVRHLKETAPDLIVVAAFGQIIPGEILRLPRYGCINVHASLLPAYRGAAPIQWCILNREKETGVTIMRMDEGLDTGDMLAARAFEIGEKETAGQLFDRMAAEGAKLLVETLPLIEAGTIAGIPQPKESTTAYASMITKEMGRIDWSAPSAEIEAKVRGMDPWPSAYSFLDGNQVKIYGADIVREDALDEEERALFLSSVPGTVLSVRKDSMTVRTGDGAIRVTELQMAGKKRMKTADFLRGYHIKEAVFI